MSANHAPDAEALRSAPRTLLVGEAPPRAGLGPLGAFDCASGQALARLDPHHGPTVDGSRLLARQCLEDTLGLLDRVNLLDTFPGRRERKGGGNLGDAWPEHVAIAATSRSWPEWTGRRVALAGRRVARAVEKATGLAGVASLPLCRWLALGGPGEPAEICVVPHPSPTNRELNPGKPAGPLLGRWLAAERARLGLAAQWIRLNARTAYRFSDGAFLGVTGHDKPRAEVVGVIDPAKASPAWRRQIMLELAVNSAGQGRFTGRGMPVTAHHLLVDELGGSEADRRGFSEYGRALTSIECLDHDLHEGLTHDIATPLKRRHASLRADERTAARAVRALIGLPPEPEPQVAALVHVADMLAREVEAVALFGFPLDDVAWPREVVGDPAPWVSRVRTLAAMSRGAIVTAWESRIDVALAAAGFAWYSAGVQ